jgi:hypothetical protein
MRRLILAIIATAFLAVMTSTAAERRPVRVVFLDNGGAIAKETLAGVKAVEKYYNGIDRLRQHPVEIVVIDANQEDDVLKEALKRSKSVAVIATPRAKELERIVRIGRRGRIPMLLTTPWEPAFSMSPKNQILHVGGNIVDQAIEAAGYCRIPLNARTVAAIHDGSAPSKALATAFLRNRFGDTKDGGAHLVPTDAGDVAGLLMRLGSQKVNAVFVALDLEDALRVTRAASDLDQRDRWAERKRDDKPVDRHKIGLEPKSTTPDRPKLLFADGVVTEEMAKETTLTARFLVGRNPDIDKGRATFFRSHRKGKKLMPSAAGERGYAAAALVMEALAACKVRARDLMPSLRALAYEELGGTQILNEWGQTRLFTWHLWKPVGQTAIRVKPTYMPDKAGGLLLKHRRTSQLTYEPGTRLIHLFWGEPEDQTIDADLARIGLSTAGYESTIDALIKNEILVRTAARLNRLFWRNADGTPIPGVSFRITFVTEIPKSYDDHHWGAKIAGDHPSAGGLAGDPYSSIFSTFIVRTMYLKHKLMPNIGRDDMDYLTGRYEWGVDLNQNIRNDEIRCLLEGLSGAFALTTAHELGHIIGCGHDQFSTRSIMNVVSGGGMDPDWAEWIPQHLRALESRLKRHETRPGRRR